MGGRTGCFSHWHVVRRLLHAAVDTVCALLSCISASFNVIPHKTVHQTYLFIYFIL